MMGLCDYKSVIKIRVFEELILELFGQNKLSGTTHTYIGEEATAVAIMKHVTDNDKVFSNHRCHGHYLAYGGPEEKLLAEIMSKETGLCQGRGGSQHIHYRNFYTNGIQGGIVPNAVGMAFADKYLGKKANTLVFLGDGTLGQGVVYESLNIASVYSIPVVFVIEDNQYAMSTKRTDVIAGDIKSRICGFDIETFEIESTDVDELDAFFLNVFSYINKERKPVCAIVHNYRLAAHSKGDDTRNPDEIAAYKENDPLKIIAQKIGADEVQSIKNEYRNKFVDIVDRLENEKTINLVCPKYNHNKSAETFVSTSGERYVESIREAFTERLKSDEHILFLGEDIREPYGGAFKATKGLSIDYDRQIINMPISEACMAGLAVGMGMNGLLPVVEMMFGDFVTLAFDQLLNHAAKYSWVYGDGIKVPMIIRTPMGAKRGYGPTHSQSLEKYMMGIPGIKIIALNLATNPKMIYKHLFESIVEPTIVVENKKMYGQKSWVIQNGMYKDYVVKEINNYGFPSLLFSIDLDAKADCVVITYGGMDEETVEASYELMLTEEIQVDVLMLTQLSPVPIEDIKEANPFGVPIVTVEEGTKTSGVGAEIISQCVEQNVAKKYGRVATYDMPIPNGIALESQIVPNKKSIIEKIKEVIGSVKD